MLHLGSVNWVALSAKEGVAACRVVWHSPRQYNLQHERRCGHSCDLGRSSLRLLYLAHGQACQQAREVGKANCRGAGLDDALCVEHWASFFSADAEDSLQCSISSAATSGKNWTKCDQRYASRISPVLEVKLNILAHACQPYASTISDSS